MAPKKGSKAKAAAGLRQPSLTFQTTKPHRQSSKALGSISASTLSVDVSETDDVEAVEPTAAKLAKATSPVENQTPVTDAQAVEDRPKLQVKSKKWDGLRKLAKTEMGGLPAIHAGPETNDIHNILRVFDLTASYGPCVGITRLQRWDRAQKWGLNPPREIREILVTKEGQTEESYKENVLYPWLG